jgi:SAM-dependent methyltransferase
VCNRACLDFAESVLTRGMVHGEDVLEVGALDVNGSVRPIVQSFDPSSYLGVDIVPGPGVDEICRIEDAVSRYGEERFGVVITTELVEHVRDWRLAFTSLKRVLRPGGILLLTTRSRGFGVHGYPYDFWRYEDTDMRQIFADFLLEELRPDSTEPGVFVLARKPAVWHPQSLEHINLYSVVTRTRVHRITPRQFWLFVARYNSRMLKRRMKGLIPGVAR